MKFSIVIPTYNRAKSIEGTLNSVLEQTFGNFECIVVDDGSDDSEELALLIERLGDPRIQCIFQKNLGGGAARTNGIMKSVGNFIAFLDSDDAFYPNKLEEVHNYICKYPDTDVWSHLALVDRGSGARIIRPTRDRMVGESMMDFMFRHREFMQTSTLVVRSSLAKEVQFDPRLKKAQDVDFVVRLERTGAVIRLIPEVLSVWNDKPAPDRIGSPRRPDSVLLWYKEQKAFMPKDTRYAFEATYLAYEVSDYKPHLSFIYILRALINGAISPKTFAMVLMRCFVPARVYRNIVDFYVRIYGKTKK